MDTPANDHTATPAQRALDALTQNTEDTTALDTLATSEVLIPVPDDAADEDTTVALPVLSALGQDCVTGTFLPMLRAGRAGEHTAVAAVARPTIQPR